VKTVELSKWRQRLKYMASDLVMTSIAFFLFDILRFKILSLYNNETDYVWSMIFSHKIMLEQTIIPIALMAVYWLSGYYNKPFHVSRLQEFITTFYSAVFNAIIIFFVLLINDRATMRSTDYLLIFSLIALLLVFTYIGRLFITTLTLKHIRKHNLRTKVLIVGEPTAALRVREQLLSTKSLMGYEIVGYIPTADNKDAPQISPVWDEKDIEKICSEQAIDQIILAPSPTDQERVVLALLDRLFPLGIPIRIFPDTLSYFTSNIRMNDILGEPFINLTSPSLGEFSKNVKSTADVLLSAIALVALSPLLLIIATAVRLSSTGPVIYKQQRIGKNRKPFMIYKFRTMYTDAEKNGPELSSEGDSRITEIGRIMRKYRLDELPQFWNVLKGDMSIVGPRPEREYYIEKIRRYAPYYSLVFQVKPGITSWGMVKFGYASSIRQMVERTKFDLIYITNMSIALDIKIMIYTVRTIFRGAGM